MTGGGGRKKELERKEKMTLAETLNDGNYSCGLDEGSTWFQDGEGMESTEVGEYSLFSNNHGIEVHVVDGGFCVAGVDINGKSHEAVFGSNYRWIDC